MLTWRLLPLMVNYFIERLSAQYHKKVLALMNGNIKHTEKALAISPIILRKNFRNKSYSLNPQFLISCLIISSLKLVPVTVTSPTSTLILVETMPSIAFNAGFNLLAQP